MHKLLGNDIKDRILEYLAENPYRSTKEIARDINVNYKYVFKILKELREKEIVTKKESKYFLKSEFVERFKMLADKMITNYTDSVLLKNHQDFYNILINFFPEDKIKDCINNEIEEWSTEKLNTKFCRYYDFENKEYNKVKEKIEDHHKKNDINVLEVGCGTGRLTKKLAKDFQKVVGIDQEKKFISYCEKYIKEKKTEFYNSNIREFKYDEKFDVILLSWIGLHYHKDVNILLDNIKRHLSKEGILIILDAYYDTEYMKILQMIRWEDLNLSKHKREVLKERLVKKFGNLNEEVLFTKYDFENTESLIENFRIKLTLEGSHVWTKEDEKRLRKHLETKEEPLKIEEGLWITTVSYQSG